MGTAFLHEAVAMRGSMDLRSYDRLFPSQDVLPAAGSGNLIAAPLNGKRRADGLTLFLDIATLEPCADQWEYLSTLPRTTPRQIAKLARRSARMQVGSDVARINRPRATAVHPRLPAKVEAELGARLVIDIDDLPPAAVSAFKHARLSRALALSDAYWVTMQMDYDLEVEKENHRDVLDAIERLSA